MTDEIKESEQNVRCSYSECNRELPKDEALRTTDGRYFCSPECSAADCRVQNRPNIGFFPRRFTR